MAGPAGKPHGGLETGVLLSELRDGIRHNRAATGLLERPITEANALSRLLKSAYRARFSSRKLGACLNSLQTNQSLTCLHSHRGRARPHCQAVVQQPVRQMAGGVIGYGVPAVAARIGKTNQHRRASHGQACAGADAPGPHDVPARLRDRGIWTYLKTDLHDLLCAAEAHGSARPAFSS